MLRRINRNFKINELAQASPAILADFENMIRKASRPKGMTKDASADGIETALQLRSDPNKQGEGNGDLKASIQGLFQLDQRNKDYERYVKTDLNQKLWR